MCDMRALVESWRYFFSSFLFVLVLRRKGAAFRIPPGVGRCMALFVDLAHLRACMILDVSGIGVRNILLLFPPPIRGFLIRTAKCDDAYQFTSPVFILSIPID